jgi:hypothetical protein
MISENSGELSRENEKACLNGFRHSGARVSANYGAQLRT